MTEKIETCAYCGRDVEHRLLEQVLRGEKELLSIYCEDGVCCVEFTCDDDWQPTLEKLIGKKIEVKSQWTKGLTLLAPPTYSWAEVCYEDVKRIIETQD